MVHIVTYAQLLQPDPRKHSQLPVVVSIVSELMLCGAVPSPSIQASGEVVCREPGELEIPAGKS